MNKETVKIEAPNLIEFVYAIEKKVKEGYSVDNTNEGIPQTWGLGYYTCTVSRDVEKTVEKPTEVVSNASEESTEAPVKKTTRRKSTK